MSLGRRLFFMATTALFAGIVAEAGLQVLSTLFPPVDRLLLSPHTPLTIPDSILIERPNPIYPGHDARGFRNPEALDHADIVTLGDSQTYGLAVPIEHTWPHRVAESTRSTVYNMGVPGWGPVESLLHWDDVVALDPELVILGVYSGNDLYDAFEMVFGRAGALTDLRSPDPALLEILREEGVRPLREFVGEARPYDPPAPAERKFPLGPLQDHSALYALARKAWFLWTTRQAERNPPGWEALRAEAIRSSESMEPFEVGPIRAVLTPRYRHRVLDITEPRLAEGLQITLRVLQRLDSLATASEIPLLVVSIPTKELVFRAATDAPTADHEQLVRAEEALWERVRTYLERRSIDYVDVLPALRRSLLEGREPYPMTFDGHPTSAGYEAIAGAVYDHLRTSGQPAGRADGASPR